MLTTLHRLPASAVEPKRIDEEARITKKMEAVLDRIGSKDREMKASAIAAALDVGVGVSVDDNPALRPPPLAIGAMSVVAATSHQTERIAAAMDPENWAPADASPVTSMCADVPVSCLLLKGLTADQVSDLDVRCKRDAFFTVGKPTVHDAMNSRRSVLMRRQQLSTARRTTSSEKTAGGGSPSTAPSTPAGASSSRRTQSGVVASAGAGSCTGRGIAFDDDTSNVVGDSRKQPFQPQQQQQHQTLYDVMLLRNDTFDTSPFTSCLHLRSHLTGTSASHSPDEIGLAGGIHRGSGKLCIFVSTPVTTIATATATTTTTSTKPASDLSASSSMSQKDREAIPSSSSASATSSSLSDSANWKRHVEDLVVQQRLTAAGAVFVFLIKCQHDLRESKDTCSMHRLDIEESSGGQMQHHQYKNQPQQQQQSVAATAASSTTTNALLRNGVTVRKAWKHVVVEGVECDWATSRCFLDVVFEEEGGSNAHMMKLGAAIAQQQSIKLLGGGRNQLPGATVLRLAASEMSNLQMELRQFKAKQFDVNKKALREQAFLASGGAHDFLDYDDDFDEERGRAAFLPVLTKEWIARFDKLQQLLIDYS